MTATMPHATLDVPVDAPDDGERKVVVRVRVRGQSNPSAPSAASIVEAIREHYVRLLREQNRAIMEEVKKSEARNPDGPKRFVRPEALQD